MSMTFDQALAAAEKALRRMKRKHHELKQSVALLSAKSARQRERLRKYQGMP